VTNRGGTGNDTSVSDVSDLIPQPDPAPGDPVTPGLVAPSVSLAVPPKCPTRTRLYRKGELVEEGFAAEGIGDRLASLDDATVWLDLNDPDEADLQMAIGEFRLHPLAVEDALEAHQRPKVNRYPSHLFVNLYAVGLTDQDLKTAEISVFVTARALITVRKDDFDIDKLIARWDAHSDLTVGGIGFLVHGLLDAIVDGHYDVVQQLGDAVDELEDHLFETSGETDIGRQGFELRKNLVQLRRLGAPLREIVRRLSRGLSSPMEPELVPYYEDVYDHALSTSEGIESALEFVDSIMHTDMNEQSNELNEVTKKLASWAAIIAVPTAITGFYGQNLPYPGFSQHWGFVLSSALIIVLAFGLYFLLRSRRWL
jgi:magnesium transporter